jgi:hypothetical protein
MKNEIIFYRSEHLSKHIEVKLEDETVWLNRNQLGELFGRDVKTIGKHLHNIFKEGELERNVVVANFATTTKHGAMEGKTQTILTEHYNLDVIISVGYRVKSKQGTQFRIWATQVLRDYLLKGYVLNQRMNILEGHVETLSKEVNRISLQLNTQELPVQGIFFEGQIFDAYRFAADLIRSAKKEIILIDNYVDDTVLTLLSKRSEKVRAILYTKSISKTLRQDLEKFNSQYEPIEMQEFSSSHDRFLLIDRKELYLIGASLKDLGKRWFGFSRLNDFIPEMLEKLSQGARLAKKSTDYSQ